MSMKDEKKKVYYKSACIKYLDEKKLQDRLADEIEERVCEKENLINALISTQNRLDILTDMEYDIENEIDDVINNGKICYLHELERDNVEEPFDEEKHHICLACAYKLMIIGREKMEFEISENCKVKIIIEEK